MEILSSVDDLPAGLRYVFTLGIFDGVHRGHQRILQRTVETAHTQLVKSVVITFEPHPAAVLRGAAPPLLCAPDERVARLARAGVDITVVQHFDAEFAAQTAEQFLRRLGGDRQIVAIVMTAESAFGHDREGNLAEVQRLSGPLGFQVVDVDQLELGGEQISSTRMRRLLVEGRLAAVRSLLGRRYAVIGEIVRGDGRGRELGYPTANFGFDEPVALPADGVYAVRVSWAGDEPLSPRRRADGVASLGLRPTFGGGRRVLEAFLFDIDEDLYGERMRLEFFRHQRGEKQFASAEALIRQMDLDAQRARNILSASQL